VSFATEQTTFVVLENGVDGGKSMKHEKYALNEYLKKYSLLSIFSSQKLFLILLPMALSCCCA
jgi:hypothetical protein